jgi:hypothetical protein
MTLKGGTELRLAFVGLRTAPLFPMTETIRIAAYSYDVAIARVIGCQFFEVPDLEFWQRTRKRSRFFQALEPG